MVQVLETPVRHTPPRRRRIWWLVPFAVVWLAILTYMLSAYVPPEIGHSRVPMHGNEVHFWLLVAHIATAAMATVTGFAQFVPWVRRRHPRIHRWTGRTYLFAGVFPSMVLAVPVAAWSPFGLSNILGLLALDGMWMFTAIAGYRAARQRRYADHRVWMIRNFAVTLASLASRPWQVLLAVLIFGPLFGPMYHNQAAPAIHDLASSNIWIALAVNVFVVEVYVQRRYGRRRAVPA